MQTLVIFIQDILKKVNETALPPITSLVWTKKHKIVNGVQLITFFKISYFAGKKSET